MKRREMLHALAAAAALPWVPRDVARAAEHVRHVRASGLGGGFEPKFFTPHEWQTVRVLVDLIIPKDQRSGSATDAGVPEFMDFVMADRPEFQTGMRGGLAWLDAECRSRFGQTLVACAEAERTQVLDDIAWPERAKPEFSHGTAFFTRFRDLTASGFWSSKLGVEDLQYMGNQFLTEWKGCPPAAVRKLGLSAAD